MTYEKMGAPSIDYMHWRHPGSRLVFRGPRKRLDGDYIAFLGGTDTYGKFIRRPFPMLLEDQLGVACVNLGWPNAGVDVFLNDSAVLALSKKARAVVLQLPDPQNMSNRFYTVHPRRNDRFIGPTDVMRSVFPEVDFTEFHFVRHMLVRVRELAPDRFWLLQHEIEKLWLHRMHLLLDHIGGEATLLWVSTGRLADRQGDEGFRTPPRLVSGKAIETLAEPTAGLVKINSTRNAGRKGATGMVFSDLEAAAAAELLDPLAHETLARRAFPFLRQQFA